MQLPPQLKSKKEGHFFGNHSLMVNQIKIMSNNKYLEYYFRENRMKWNNDQQGIISPRIFREACPPPSPLPNVLSHPLLITHASFIVDNLILAIQRCDATDLVKISYSWIVWVIQIHFDSVSMIEPITVWLILGNRELRGRLCCCLGIRFGCPSGESFQSWITTISLSLLSCAT